MIFANFISPFDRKNGKFILAEYLTYKKVFEEVELFALKDPQKPDLNQNILLLAFNEKLSPKGLLNEISSFCLLKKIKKIPSLKGIPYLLTIMPQLNFL
jgi:hypothetical protein